MRKPKEPPRLMLTLLFTLIVFCVLIVTVVIVGVAVFALVQVGILTMPSLGLMLLTAAIASVVVGTVISAFAARIPAKPVSKLIYGMNSLASGNYETRLPTNVPKIGRDVAESFNLLAEELQNTELLRADFVNNFSHEFKTPLVSIRGFARLLQKGNLPEEKQQEYLAIITSESARLADMATKVLDLTKLENQNILTDVSDYNLSEQLRECILLLERRWSEKGLAVSADFGEYQIRGNQEMLKQVWINLLDNAVKFSEPGGPLDVAVRKEPGAVLVSVSNRGPEIGEADKKRIFQKFYQCDTSHTAQGNGIGLAIVHRIVTLHEGEVWADSRDGTTVFTVKLPAEA